MIVEEIKAVREKLTWFSLLYTLLYFSWQQPVSMLPCHHHRLGIFSAVRQ